MERNAEEKKGKAREETSDEQGRGRAGQVILGNPLLNTCSCRDVTSELLQANTNKLSYQVHNVTGHCAFWTFWWSEYNRTQQNQSLKTTDFFNLCLI